MSSENLFAQTTCYIKGEKKEGKVIAVSKTLDRRRVCFLLPEQQRGLWVPEEALFEDLEKKARERREAAMQPIEQVLIVPKSASTQTTPAVAQTRAQIKAQEIERAVNSNQNLSKLKEEADSRKWGQLVSWTAESAFDTNFVAAQSSVSRLEKKRCAGQSPNQIAHKLIVHKSLQAAGFEGIRGTGVGSLLQGLAGIELPRLSKLSAEMVYQIADIYGFPLNPLEAVAIFGMTLLVDKAIDSGIGWLKWGGFASKALSVTAKGLTIYAIGHLACAFYEFKAQQNRDPLTSTETLESLKQSSTNYLSDATSELAIREKIADEIEQAFPPIDYSRLESLLSEHHWENADRETGNIIQQLLAENLEDDTRRLPSQDLRKMNLLWRNNSRQHFGLSVQRGIYVEKGRKVGDFGETVGWRGKPSTLTLGGVFAWKEYKNLTFQLEYASKGHLPAFWLDEYQDQHKGVVVEKYLIPIFERNDWLTDINQVPTVPQSAPAPTVIQAQPQYQPQPTPAVAQAQPQYQPQPTPAVAQPQPQYQPQPTPAPAVAQYQPQPQPAPAVAQTPAPTVIQAQPQPTPAPTVIQAQPQPTPAPAVAQTPAPTVVQAQPQYQPQPTPAPTVVQAQAQPQPTPAPTVIQAQPQPTPAPAVAQTPAPTVVQAQPQPQPTPAPTVVQAQAQPQPTPAPAVAQTPAPTVIQAQPQPTPAPTVIQAQPQPTSAPTVVQAQPQPTPAPTVIQAQPQPTPAPTVVQATSSTSCSRRSKRKSQTRGKTRATTRR